MRPEPLPRPEADVIAAIDALVDEQLHHPERFHVVGDRRACDLCGGEWHGLPGEGPAIISCEGTPGAESYPTVGNGGAPGCPGAYATPEQREAWIKAHTYVDQIEGAVLHTDGTYRATVEDYRNWRNRWGGYPPHIAAQVGAYAREHTCRADRNGRCIWANCPRDTMFEDVILAQQQMILGCPPRPEVEVTGTAAAPRIRYWDAQLREIRNPVERFRATIEQIMEVLGQIIGIPAIDFRTWLPGEVTPQAPTTPPLVYARPVDLSGLTGPTGTILPDGIIDDQLEGFEPIGTLGEVDDAPPGYCDESHCYCDSPHRCRWNRTDGPQPPVRTEIYGEVPRPVSARASRRRAARRRPVDPPPTCAGSVGGGQAFGDVPTTPPWVIYHDDPEHQGGYTLDDLHRLRQGMWERRPPRQINMHVVVGAGENFRCHQCQRHLPAEHALVGYGDHLDAPVLWCGDCADNWTQTHPVHRPFTALHAMTRFDMNVGDLLTFEGLGTRQIMRVTEIDGDTYTAVPINMLDDMPAMIAPPNPALPAPMQFPRY